MEECGKGSWEGSNSVGMGVGDQWVFESLLFRTVVPNLGPPGVLELQLPEILGSRDGGEGFWEL